MWVIAWNVVKMIGSVVIFYMLLEFVGVPEWIRDRLWRDSNS